MSSLAVHTPRFNRAQPVIAVVAENTFTELTDYVVPYGILSESGVAQVFAIATQPGPIRMLPALQLEPQATISDFDSRFPEGADYVVVPAVLRQEDPTLLGWIQEQAEKGATVVGVCDGSWVLAHAGLLNDRQGVGHWFSFNKLSKTFPQVEWLRNTRYVADGNVVTTTGITACIPMCVALVEAIAGPDQAASLARRMGIASWGPEHESQQFKLSANRILTALTNKLAFWSHQDIGIPVDQGVDEVALALVADAYSRTYLSKAFSLGASGDRVTTKRGLVILPDRVEGDDKAVSRRVDLPNLPAIAALEAALQAIEQQYGAATAAFVALQLEYPRQKSDRPLPS